MLCSGKISALTQDTASNITKTSPTVSTWRLSTAQLAELIHSILACGHTLDLDCPVHSAPTHPHRLNPHRCAVFTTSLNSKNALNASFALDAVTVPTKYSGTSRGKIA